MSMRGKYGSASEIAARLERMKGDVSRAVEVVVREAAERARERASAAAPVGDGSDGGHLRDCIRAEFVRGENSALGRVIAENPHAAYVEFGTGQRRAGSPAPPKWAEASGYGEIPGMPAQPYLMPAAAEGRDEFFREAARAVRAALKGECV